MFDKLDKITMCSSPKPQQYHQATKKPAFGETNDSICISIFQSNGNFVWCRKGSYGYGNRERMTKHLFIKSVQITFSSKNHLRNLYMPQFKIQAVPSSSGTCALNVDCWRVFPWPSSFLNNLLDGPNFWCWKIHDSNLYLDAHECVWHMWLLVDSSMYKFLILSKLLWID